MVLIQYIMLLFAIGIESNRHSVAHISNYLGKYVAIWFTWQLSDLVEKTANGFIANGVQTAYYAADHHWQRIQSPFSCAHHYIPWQTCCNWFHMIVVHIGVDNRGWIHWKWWPWSKWCCRSSFASISTAISGSRCIMLLVNMYKYVFGRTDMFRSQSPSGTITAGSFFTYICHTHRVRIRIDYLFRYLLFSTPYLCDGQSGEFIYSGASCAKYPSLGSRILQFFSHCAVRTKRPSNENN